MAQRDTKVIEADTWTQLTDADVSAITFQNQSGVPVLIAGTSDATAPTDQEWPSYAPGLGEKNVTLSDLFPSVSGVDRVWAYCPKQRGVIWLSHA